MHNASRRPALINRALTNLVAIIAVSTIFGAKAVELEKRQTAAQVQTERLVSARP